MSDPDRKIQQSVSNNDLITRCLQGNQDAWQVLVDRYIRLVRSIPARMGLSPTEVDDVGQEVFMSLVRFLHTIDDPEKLPSWLITTAQRSSWRMLQKRKRENVVDEPTEFSEIESTRADVGTSARPLVAGAAIPPTLDELMIGWIDRKHYLLGFRPSMIVAVNC